MQRFPLRSLRLCERHKLFLSPVRCTHSSPVCLAGTGRRQGVATPRTLRHAFDPWSFTLFLLFSASLRLCEKLLLLFLITLHSLRITVSRFRERYSVTYRIFSYPLETMRNHKVSSHTRGKGSRGKWNSYLNVFLLAKGGGFSDRSMWGRTLLWRTLLRRTLLRRTLLRR